MDYLITKNDVTYRCTSDILEHHGIKGQKWGVRRYQNPDGSLTAEGKKRAKEYQKTTNKNAKKGMSREYLYSEARTIPAGIKMYRTSVNPAESKEGPKYVTYVEPERNLYKAGWVRQTAGAKKAYEYTYELKKDLKVPSRKEQEEVINKVVSSNKKLLSEAVHTWYDIRMPKGSLARARTQMQFGTHINNLVDETIKNFKDNSPEQAAFYVSQTLGLAKNVKAEVISELSKRGYNAMADEASIGGRGGYRREGYDPLIIFDSSVLDTKKTKNISFVAETNALNKFNTWSNKPTKKDAKWSDI